MRTQTARRRGLSCALLVAGFSLAGCSSDPSEADILAALSSNTKFLASLAIVTGTLDDAQLAKTANSGVVEKSGCATAQGAPGFMCDFKWGMKQGNAVRWGTPMKGRFFKSGATWAAEI